MHFLARVANQPYLLLTLTSLFWAGNAVVGRALSGRIPPVALAETRWIGAFIILIPFAWPAIREELPLIRRHIGILLFLSFCSITVFNTALYWSLQYTTAINATLVQSAGPLLIGIWSMVLFSDPLTRRQMAGIVVSLAGVLIIVSGGELARLAALSLNAGDVAILAALVVHALYSTLLRKRPAISQLSFATLTIGFGAILLLPATLIEYLAGGRFAPLDIGSVAGLAYVILFPSILAHLCFNRGVQLIGANRAGPFFHLIPLFGAILAVVFLGERPGIYHGIGAILILGGVVVANRRPASRGKPGLKRVDAGFS
jgi:drug/metabolite transporter (DMT)-like permease